MTTIRYPLESTRLELSESEIEATLARLPRAGTYQVEFSRGLRAVSGSDLAGKAKDYSGSYARGRKAVIAAAAAAGVELVKVVGTNGRRSIWSASELAAELGVPATV